MSLLLLTMLFQPNLRAEKNDVFLRESALAPFSGVLVHEPRYREYTKYRLKYMKLNNELIDLKKEWEEYDPKDCETNFLTTALLSFIFGAAAVHFTTN